MDLMLSPEEQQIIDGAATVLLKELPVAHTRWDKGPLAAPDRGLLSTFAELGWMGLGLAEDLGGIGFEITDQALLFVEIGRALVTPMVLAAAIGARVAAMAGRADLVEAIVAGELKLGFAIAAEAEGRAYVIDATDADWLVVVGEGSVWLASPEACGGRDGMRGVDGTVTLQQAQFPAETGGVVPEKRDMVFLGCCLSLLIAAMLVGMGEAVRDLTVNHAKEREQFGQKIGAFQAVSHPCADMAVRSQSALSQMKMAAITLRDGREDAEFQVTSARILAVGAAIANAQAAVQLHGGMGFAAEYPVHLFLKRAHLLDQIGGSMARQLDRLFLMEAPV